MTDVIPAEPSAAPTDAAALAALTQPAATEPVEPVAAEPEPAAPRITIPDSVIGELTGLRSAKRDLEAENARIRREAADARALAERLQRGNGQTDPATAPAPTPAPSQDQYQADVNRAAEMQRVMEDTVAIRNAGMIKFPDFQQTLNTLTALGVTSNLDIVMDILAVDRANAHVMLDSLAKDPEKAASIAQMTPRSRIAELTRMTTVTTAAPAPKAVAQPAAPAPKTVSRA